MRFYFFSVPYVVLHTCLRVLCYTLGLYINGVSGLVMRAGGPGQGQGRKVNMKTRLQPMADGVVVNPLLYKKIGPTSYYIQKAIPTFCLYKKSDRFFRTNKKSVRFFVYTKIGSNFLLIQKIGLIFCLYKQKI